MNTESKGTAWFDKLYQKFETILEEVDNFVSQDMGLSDPPGPDSVKAEPKKLAEDHCKDTLDMNHQADLPRCKVDSAKAEPGKLAEDHCSSALDMNHQANLPRCKSRSDMPSDHNVDISQSLRLEDQLEGHSLKKDEEILSSSSLLQDHSDCNQTKATSRSQGSQFPECSSESFRTGIACNDAASSGISTGDSNPITLATDFQAASVQDKVSNKRSSTSNSMKANQDKSVIKNIDATPLKTIDSDDNLLYAAHARIKKLRSFKRKIMDAFTSKSRREKEYENLPIWFGDADMTCDLINTTDNATTSLDSKDSQSNLTFASEDSEWEIL